MSAEFVGKMSSAVESLSGGFQSFTGGTFTEAVWFGEAADNAKNQVSEKIDTKIEEIKSKLQNLSSAIAKADEAAQVKKEISSCESSISGLNSSYDDYKEKLAQWEARKKELQESYDNLISEIKGLCS